MNKEIKDLKSTICKQCIYRTMLSKKRIYTILKYTWDILQNHILGQNTNLITKNKLKPCKVFSLITNYEIKQ